MKQKTKKIVYIKFLFLAFFCVASLVFFANTVFAAQCGGGIQDQPGVINCACGDNVVSNYTMTSDLVCDTYPAFTIGDATNNPNSTPIVLNCDEHLIWVDSSLGGTAITNFCNSTFCRENFTVKNCDLYDSGISVNTSGGAALAKINNVRIENNRIRSAGIFGYFSNNPQIAPGINNVITGNTITDRGGIQMYNASQSTISYNRVVKQPALGFPFDDGSAPLYIERSTNLKIFGNYFDCFKIPNYAGSQTCNGDIYLKSAGGVVTSAEIYDNVFASFGYGYDTTNAVPVVNWCPPGEKKNIFSSTASLPSGCDAACGGCSKACLAERTFSNTYTFQENTCLIENPAGGNNDDVDYDFTDPDFTLDGNDGTPAFQAQYSNNPASLSHNGPTMLFCDRDATGNRVRIKGDAAKNMVGARIGIVGVDPVRVSENLIVVAGCYFEDFQKGIHIVNSQDVFLRENVVGSSSASTENEIQYFYRIDSKISSDPFYDKNHFRHSMYPEEGYAGCYGPEGMNEYYRNVLNYIRKPSGNLYHVLHYFNVDSEFMFRDGEMRGVPAFPGDVNCIPEPFSQMGHLTMAKANGFNIRGISIDTMDPITFVEVRGKTEDPDIKRRVTEVTVRNNFHEGFVIRNSENIQFFGNIFTNNEIGLKIHIASNLDIFDNIFSSTATSTKPNTYGGQFFLVSESTIGHETDSSQGNNFDNNKVSGLYIEGGNTTPAGPDNNRIVRNTFNNNGLWGLIGYKVVANEFIVNTIQSNGFCSDSGGAGCSVSVECSNGIDDDFDGKTDGYANDDGCLNASDNDEGPAYVPGGVGESAACNNGVDDDGDGKRDFDRKDPECTDENDPYESYPPAVYLNQAYNNMFDSNTINFNVGDGIFIDSAVPYVSGTQICPVPQQTVEDTRFNIFVNNTIDGGVASKGSGVVLTSGHECGSGSVYKNVFGYFYLENESDDADTNDRSNYSTDPDNPFEWNQFESLWIQPLSRHPGNNTIRNHFLDGITIARNTKSVTSDKRIYENDIYLNNIRNNNLSNNNRHGIYFYGKENTKFLLNNDIIANTITDDNGAPLQEHGIYLFASNFSRIFGNNITNNAGYGISAENTVFSPTLYYNEIGHTGNHAASGVDYSNIITNNNKRGVFVSSAPNTRIIDNTVSNTASPNEYGVYLLESSDVRVESNTIEDFTLGGLVGELSDSVVAIKNVIRDGTGVQNRGMAIWDSSGWQVGVGAGNGNTTSNITSPGRYLYVGPKVVTPYTPYPNNNKKIIYDHDIPSNNTAEGLPIWYHYEETSIHVGTGVEQTKHLQIIGKNSATDIIYFIDNLAFTDADPVEISYVNSGGNGDVKNVIFSNCRGDCLTLHGVNFVNPDLNTPDSTFDNISITNPSQNGVTMKYVSNVSFINSTLGDGSSNGVEYGLLYLYHAEGNTITDNKLTYADTTNNFDEKKWEMFLAGDSKENVIWNNYFSFSLDGIGPGAFELRAERKTSGSLNPLIDGTDKLCTATDGDGLCDPNCTIYQDDDCADIFLSFSPPSCPQNGIAEESPNCCRDVFDGEVDPDCPNGVDPDFHTTLSYSVRHGDDDGICVYGSQEPLDPNCTAVTGVGTGSCGFLEFGNTDCYLEDPGNWCTPLRDNVCDYDCPAGFDPDCVAFNNSWCDSVGSQRNNFDNLPAALEKPNYYDAVIGPGGGGIPNGHYFCYVPRARFQTTDPVLQGYGDGYRLLDIGNGLGERGRYKYRFETKMRFADQRGLGLWAGVLAGAAFTAGSDFYTPLSATITPIPAINNSDATYALGTSAGYIETESFEGTYPLNLWGGANDSKINNISVLWDAYGNSAWNTGLWPVPDHNETQYARIQAINTAGRVGATATAGDDLDVSFQYDFQAPCGGTASSCPSSGTPKLNDPTLACVAGNCSVTWAPLSATDEPSWTTPNKAHYEVWYGEESDEVRNRANDDDNGGSGPAGTPDPVSNGPFLWDDIGYNLSSGLRNYYEHQATPPVCAGTKDHCDEDLKNIGTPPFVTTVIKTNLTDPVVNVCAVDNFGNETCGQVPPVYPWVETRYGNIYSGGDIIADDLNVAPQGKFNATFVIRAKGSSIVNWEANPSSSGIPEEKRKETGFDSGETNTFPQKSNQYTISLGSFDFLNKPHPANYLNEVEKHLVRRYGGHRVIRFTNANFSTNVPSMLDGKIYIADENITIASEKTFTQGAGTQNGSGLIIINGNLTINANITYAPGAPLDKVKNLSSVVWIVMGDITVAPSVDTISGSFLALGIPNRYPFVGGGYFNTGDDSSSPKKLLVNGMLMAHEFNFQRTYTSQTEGSEIIVYDGRIFANPPLGIEDFSKNLPKWTKNE